MLNANNASLSVFLTAATSSVGREVTRQLIARGHRVTGLTEGSQGAAIMRKEGALPAYSDPFRAGELRSMIKMASADVVIHVLPQDANVFPYKGLTIAESKRLISDSTAAVVEAAAEAGAKFLVLLSSAALYADAHGEWVDESGRAGSSALAKAIASAEAKVLHGSVPAAVLRAGIVYGAFDSGLKALGDAALRAHSVYLGDSHAYHNWIHEADLAKAAVLAAEQQPAGQVFNIVDDTPASAGDFVAYLAGSLGMPTPTPLNPPAFTLERVTSDVQREVLNNSVRVKNAKAKESLGWSPRYTNFRPGIDQALMVWRSEPVAG